MGENRQTAASDRADYPSALCARERELVWQRRSVALGRSAGGGEGLPDDTVALALSGGGIRSATFCLGVLQALARAALLRKVDILSTVSGGGYCGGFLGALINRSPAGAATGVEAAEAELANPRSPIVKWLRENGRYLSPNGAGDAWMAFAVMLRNWVAVQVVLVTMAVAALAAVIAARIPLEGYAGHIAGEPGTMMWSPLFWVPLGLLIFPVLPLGCAYWLAPRVNPETGKPISLVVLFRAFVLVLLLAVAFVVTGRYEASDAAVAAKIDGLRQGLGGGVLVLAVALMMLGVIWIGSGIRADSNRPERRTRNLLSSLLAQSLKFAFVAAGVALIDSLGETLCNLERFGLTEMTGLLGAGGAAALARPLITLAQRGNGKGRGPLPLGVIAGGAAVLIAATILVLISAGAHAIVRDALLLPWADEPGLRLWSALTLLGSALLFSYFLGATLQFANDSSQQALYGARLARAYLGASNPARRAEGGGKVTEPIPGDDPAFDKYAPHAHGGPLHLINLTLNETVSGESQIEHRDRKGLIMTIGPAGISAGVRHHALWRANGSGIESNAIEPVTSSSGYQIFISSDPPADAPAGTHMQKVEPLSVSAWVAISGAAAGPGLGALTSLGYSLLLTLFNVRLGYWWDSYIAPRARKAHGSLTPAQHFGRVIAWLFPVQTYLCYELLARFYGPNRRHWYLSDGGHFENTACYELIRRRVPFIIACDCGQDAAFKFADVANLVRKARTDFDAEIRFLTRAELSAMRVDDSVIKYFGVPAEFAPLSPAAESNAAREWHRPCAMLARVDYDGNQHRAGRAPDSIVLFLKPSLTGEEPEDILNYAKTNPDFPHQSTGDQYFDEAQWEAYRKLGEIIAGRLFAQTPAGGWTPRSCTKPSS
jgi:hypothetical protein